MADTFTTNYSWTKPAVGADSGSWGGLLNADLDAIDATVFTVSGVASAALPLAGGTMTGAILNTQTGLQIKGASANALTLKPNETMSAARTLNYVGHDADRTIDFSGNLTVGSGGATIAGTFSGASSGTNTGDQTIALTGDVTGSGTGSFAATIGSNKVTNAKMATMADQTIKGNVSGSTAAPSDLTAAQIATLIGVQLFSSFSLGAPFSGGAYTATHALGARPRIIQAYLVCVSPELGYSSGDMVSVILGTNGGTVWANATTVGVSFSTAGAIQVVNRAGGSTFTTVTSANWTVALVAYK